MRTIRRVYRTIDSLDEQKEAERNVGRYRRESFMEFLFFGGSERKRERKGRKKERDRERFNLLLILEEDSGDVFWRDFGVGFALTKF